ncbi:MAG: complex I subunit 1 family protein [Planctomycetota bacterium]
MLQLIVSLIVILVVIHTMLGACAYLIFLERKVAAWTQDRIGPNRTNFSFGILPIPERFFMFGLGQALADGIKLLLKEDYTPPHVDRWLFALAPAFMMIPALIGWAVIPWGGLVHFPEFTLYYPWLEAGMRLGWYPATTFTEQVVTVAVAPISIGAVYLLAIGSLSVYGIALGSYASNNKYSFFGGMRAVAQMLSYEIPLGLVVLICILAYGTASTENMVLMQSGEAGMAWGIFLNPLLAVIFFTAALAESNRAPFDLAEAEQELVGGFHTEYGSMRWALFFLGEYMHMITSCAFFAVLFLGGWQLAPFPELLPGFLSFLDLPAVATGWFWEGTDAAWLGSILLVFVKFNIFAGKVTLLLFVMMWVRWSLPRFRYDQLMGLAWKGLIPMCVAALVGATVIEAMGLGWWAYLVMNVVVLIGAVTIGPMLPAGSVNKRVGLSGSRFSPADEGDGTPMPNPIATTASARPSGA